MRKIVANTKQPTLNFRSVEQKLATTGPVARKLYNGTLNKLVVRIGLVEQHFQAVGGGQAVSSPLTNLVSTKMRLSTESPLPRPEPQTVHQQRDQPA